jgi:hypothetical protein
MRTLATQVKLRRLIRAFGEAHGRLVSEPVDRRTVGSIVARLLELSADLRDTWRQEGRVRPLEAPPEGPLARYVKESLRTVELAIAGLGQAGADLELLRGDFESAALPLEMFLRGLDAEPALQRSA